MWTFDQLDTLRHIEIAPLGEGWTVAEATVANAQFFWRRSDAETAARGLAARLAEVGEPSRIDIRLRNGESGGRFVSTMRQARGRAQP